MLNEIKILKKCSCLLWILFIFPIGCASEKINPQTNTEVTVDADYLYSVVKTLTEIDPPRNHENMASLDIAADYIKKELIRFGYSPVEQRYHIDGKEYKNIIASFGPKEAPRFIVGAHYDVFENQSGADDNASGVAGLLELARLFQHTNPALDIRIDFVAFTLEEPPFFRTQQMGSYIHAKSLDDLQVNIIGMVSLEMIGFFTDAKKSQQYPLHFTLPKVTISP